MQKTLGALLLSSFFGCLAACKIIINDTGNASATAGESDSGLDPTEGQDQVPEACGPLNNSYYEPLSNECFCDASYEWCYPNDLYNYECCIHCDSSNTPEQLLVQEGGTCYPDLKLDHCSNRGAKDNACGLYESVYFVCLPNEEQPATGPRKGKWVSPATNNFGCELRGFTKYNGCYEDEQGRVVIACK